MSKKAEFLKQNKPKVKSVPVDGRTIYLRESTIGDNNFVLFERRSFLIALAEKAGEQFDFTDEADVEAKLRRYPDKFAMARGAAQRICDEDGELLFDGTNQDDLEALNKLGESVLRAIHGDPEKKKEDES